MPPDLLARLAWGKQLMTDWDAREKEILQERYAAAEARRREQQARELETQEKADAIWAKLRDVADWAIKRYKAANIQPMPVGVRWEEEEKPFLRKPRKEIRRLLVAEVYPLRRYSQHFEGSGEMGSSHDQEEMNVVTEDMKFFIVYPDHDKNTTDVFYHRDSCPQNPEELLTSISSYQGVPYFPAGYSGNPNIEIDKVCDDIVSWVSYWTNPQYADKRF